MSTPDEAREQFVRDIARELYDGFVMGGWEPQDAYPQIRAMLASAGMESHGWLQIVREDLTRQLSAANRRNEQLIEALRKIAHKANDPDIAEIATSTLNDREHASTLRMALRELIQAIRQGGGWPPGTEAVRKALEEAVDVLNEMK